jgi:hypothetical protein
VVFLCKHENRERYKRIELEDLESKVKRRKMATMDKEGLTIKARPLLSLGPASCEPGLLGIFLWYRPGLFQCRFRYNLYREIANFSPAGFTAIPGRQYNRFPSALV